MYTEKNDCEDHLKDTEELIVRRFKFTTTNFNYCISDIVPFLKITAQSLSSPANCSN